MSSTPRQLLAEFTTAAARLTLSSSQFAGQRHDPAQFAHAKRPQMLQVIARLPQLRAELAEQYRDELAGAHPALLALVGADEWEATAAAAVLADPAQVKRLTREQPAVADALGSAAPTSDERAAKRTEQRLAKLRADRDRAQAQRDQAQTEMQAVRRELAEAIDDRDEALAIVEAMRAELESERHAAATLARNALAAARLLAATARAATASAEPVIAPGSGDGARAATAGRGAGREPDVDAGVVAQLRHAAGAVGVALPDLLAVFQALAAPPALPAPALTRSREIALTPLGGGTDIGGSCMLVTAGDVRILVDAGMRMKQRIDQAGPPDITVARAGRLDAVIITHAHNDHAGYVPALTADYPNLRVLCSPDTAALLPTMWFDSVKVFGESRSDYVEDGDPPADPPYGETQVYAALRRIEPVEFNTEPVDIADGVRVELFPAGHILGAAGVVVTAGDRRVVVTGDVSDLAQASVPGLIVPEAARQCDLLVIESTYCGPKLTNREAEVAKFLRRVDEIVTRGGRVLVPAFALGRAQEVALTLRERLPNVPVLIDGMAKAISRTYEQQTADTDRPLRIFSDQVREVGRGMRAQEIRTFRRGVVVTTSGMLTSGPAVPWARAILPDADAALFVAGYQDEESPGYHLIKLSEERRAGATFHIDGEDVPVQADVKQFTLSAHADRKGLSGIIRQVDPRQVMLVHGEARKQRDFADNLIGNGFTVAPTRHWQG